MWGTHAAALAAVDVDILRSVSKRTRRLDNVAFVVRTQVVNGAATGPEIEFDGGSMIAELVPKLDDGTSNPR